MTQKKYPLCPVCNKPYTERKGLRFRHYDQDQAGVYWHSANPVFPVKMVEPDKLCRKCGKHPIAPHQETSARLCLLCASAEIESSYPSGT